MTQACQGVTQFTCTRVDVATPVHSSDRGRAQQIFFPDKKNLFVLMIHVGQPHHPHGEVVRYRLTLLQGVDPWRRSLETLALHVVVLRIALLI
jgi:hypothetical protein